MTNLELAQRLSVVETQMREIRTIIQELKDDFRECSKNMSDRMTQLEDSFDDLALKLDTFGKLNGRDKAAIIVACLTGFVALIIAVVK